MSTGHKVAAAGLAVLAVTAVAGCAGGASGAAPAQLGVCDLALDVTGHPGVTWVRETVEQGLPTLQDKQCRDLVVTANLITDYSKANKCPEVLVNTNPGDSGNKKTDDRRRTEAWQGQVTKSGEVRTPGVEQLVDGLLDCGVYGPGADPASSPKLKLTGTDVFTAIQASAEAMNGIPEPHKLIVISDMRNTKAPLKMPFSGSVDQEITKLARDNVIPDLTGAEVMIVGSGTSDELSPKDQAKLVDFWKAYFKKANAGSVSFLQTIS